MSDDRLRRIEELYHAAIARPAESRAMFLAEACGGDEALRREVADLVAHAIDDSFLQEPAVLEPAMTLQRGAQLGPYTIAGPIGAGGMGEVFRARDTRLDRDVAIKVLPQGFAADADRVARFQSEAKAIAALSHPNILAIHDIGTATVSQGSEKDLGGRFRGGTQQETTSEVFYVVTELLEGETLRARLRTGPLPVKKAIDYAVQIARGLAAAHDKGIVHRDLKPENVFLLEDGRIKILDFGLAKRAGPCRGAVDAATAVTEEGTVVGTAGYMAPEQVRGQAVDARTDLFALGVVLYEMLADRRAFQRDTTAETMTAILNEDPPEIASTRADVPPALEHIVRHALEKNPVERFQSARDVAFALEALSGSGAVLSSPTAAAPPSRGGWRRLIAVGVMSAVVLVAIAVAADRWLSPPHVSTPWSGIRLGGPEIAGCPRVSPDGGMLALAALSDNQMQVGLMKPESGTWTYLTHKRNAGSVWNVAWAPAGEKVYFDRVNDVPIGVFSVPLFGADEQLVAEGAQSPTPLRDGSLLVTRLNAAHQYRLSRFWPETGKWQEFPIDTGVTSQQARLSSDGQEALILGTLVSDGPLSGRHLYALDLASGRVRRFSTGLQDDSSISAIAVTRVGQSVLAVRGSGTLRQIVTIPIHGGSAPRTLFTLTMYVDCLDAGPDGRIYLDQEESQLAVLRFSPEGNHAEKLEVPLDAGLKATVLPDGRLATSVAVGGRRHVVAIEAGKDPRALVTTEEETIGPVTMAGPLAIAFQIGPKPFQIAVATLANGRITARIPFDKGPINSLAASADGRMLFVAADGTIWAQPVSGGEPRKIRAGNSATVDPASQHVLVQVFDMPETRLFDVPLDGSVEREIPLNGPFHLSYEPLGSSAIRDGRLVVGLLSPDSWFMPPGVVDLATGRMTEIKVDRFGDYHFLLWTPDGHVIAGTSDPRSRLWRFQPEGR